MPIVYMYVSPSKLTLRDLLQWNTVCQRCLNENDMLLMFLFVCLLCCPEPVPHIVRRYFSRRALSPIASIRPTQMTSCKVYCQRQAREKCIISTLSDASSAVEKISKTKKDTNTPAHARVSPWVGQNSWNEDDTAQRTARMQNGNTDQAVFRLSHAR